MPKKQGNRVLTLNLDGKTHEFQQEYDQNRERILNDLGLIVIRFKNEELEDMQEVLRKIRAVMKRGD